MTISTLYRTGTEKNKLRTFQPETKLNSFLQSRLTMGTKVLILGASNRIQVDDWATEMVLQEACLLQSLGEKLQVSGPQFFEDVNQGLRHFVVPVVAHFPPIQSMRVTRLSHQVQMESRSTRGQAEGTFAVNAQSWRAKSQLFDMFYFVDNEPISIKHNAMSHLQTNDSSLKWPP